jgi:hypothetical protein
MPFDESYSKPFRKTEDGYVCYVCEAEMCREDAKLHAEVPCVLKKAKSSRSAQYVEVAHRLLNPAEA